MSYGSEPKEFTGRHMLIVMVCFFAAIIVANLTMAIAANRTWTGFVVANSYVASQKFNERAAEGRAQAALGWVSRFNYNSGHISYLLRNREGFPIDMQSVTVTFRRPATVTEDKTVVLTRDGESHEFAAEAAIGDGVWIVEAHADVGKPAAYRYVRRIMIRNGALQ